jgi:tetratricopeptide (TPR) repeat protein
MKYHDEALPIARLRNHPFSIAWALLMAGRVNRLLGNYSDAISASKEAISICQRYGFPAREATVRFVLGSAQFDSGEFEEGLSNMRSGYERWASSSGRFHASWFLADFADCLCRADRKDECQSIVARAEAVAAETEEKSHAAELYRLRGLLLFKDGSIEQARASIHQSLALSQERKTKLFELRAARDLLKISTGTENEDAAKMRLRQVVSSFASSPVFPELLQARGMIA